MSKTPEKLQTKDKHLFSEAVSGITPIKQDRNIPFSENNCVFIPKPDFNISDKMQDNLSDEYDPFDSEEDKFDLNYYQQSIGKKRFQSLRKGYFESEQILDLHGLNRQQARELLLEFIQYCNNKHFRKVTVMPGFGQGILRQSLNIWLRQLPQVLAFAESPQKSGGKGTIRLLLSASKEIE